MISPPVRESFFGRGGVLIRVHMGVMRVLGFMVRGFGFRGLVRFGDLWCGIRVSRAIFHTYTP